MCGGAGEDDSITSARTLFANAEVVGAALVAVAEKWPGIVGFNIDLETHEGRILLLCITMNYMQKKKARTRMYGSRTLMSVLLLPAKRRTYQALRPSRPQDTDEPDPFY